MTAYRIIACLDTAGGRVVKGIRFAALRDAGDPARAAALYCEQGADEIVLLDVTATIEDRATATATVSAVSAAIDVPLTAGGGVRSLDDVARLLYAGADKVVINSAAFADPMLIAKAARRFGSQSIVVALDARRIGNGYELRSHAGRNSTGLDPAVWAHEMQERGAGEILLTSIDRDGTRCGFDLDLLRSVACTLSIPLVASGGAASPESFVRAFQAGAQAALGASVFHDGLLEIGEVKRYCRAHGLEVRP
jgi:cyclase